MILLSLLFETLLTSLLQMRFQALMPDILHWLGIKKIDRMLSMSNMKHDAIVDSGIKIHERIPIPEEMIPNDSRVEIDAKINAGYFTTGKQFTMEELAQVKGRGWEKWEDITVSIQIWQYFLFSCLRYHSTECRSRLSSNLGRLHGIFGYIQHIGRSIACFQELPIV